MHNTSVAVCNSCGGRGVHDHSMPYQEKTGVWTSTCPGCSGSGLQAQTDTGQLTPWFPQIADPGGYIR